jgi:hypothetical protein
MAPKEYQPPGKNKCGDKLANENSATRLAKAATSLAKAMTRLAKVAMSFVKVVVSLIQKDSETKVCCKCAKQHSLH